MSNNSESPKEGKRKNTKKYYLQFPQGFFNEMKNIMLEQLAGSEGLVIYLKLATLSLSENGHIECNFPEMPFEDELALALNNRHSAEQIRKTVRTCLKLGLVEPLEADVLFYIPFADIASGGCGRSETDSAERMRRKRKRDRASQAKAAADHGDDESEDHIAENGEASQCDGKASLFGGNTEITETEYTREQIETEKSNNISFLFSESVSLEKPLFDEKDVASWHERFGDGYAGTGRAAETAPVPAAALTLDDWREISKVGKVGLNEAGLEAYYKETLAGKWFNQEIPLKGLRGWAKKFRKIHPEWFCSTPGDGDVDQVSEAGTDTEPDGGAGQSDKTPAWMNYFTARDKDGEIFIKVNPIEAQEIYEGIAKKARQGYSNREFQNLVDGAYLDVYDEEYFNDLLNDDFSEAEARREIRNDAKKLVTMRQVVDLVKKNPNSFSTEEIAAVWEQVSNIARFNGLEEESENFKEFLLKHRRNG